MHRAVIFDKCSRALYKQAGSKRDRAAPGRPAAIREHIDALPMCVMVTWAVIPECSQNKGQRVLAMKRAL